MVSVCLMLAADRTHIVAANYGGSLRVSACVTLAGQIVTLLCNLLMVRRAAAAAPPGRLHPADAGRRNALPGPQPAPPRRAP